MDLRSISDFVKCKVLISMPTINTLSWKLVKFSSYSSSDYLRCYLRTPKIVGENAPTLPYERHATHIAPPPTFFFPYPPSHYSWKKPCVEYWTQNFPLFVIFSGMWSIIFVLLVKALSRWNSRYCKPSRKPLLWLNTPFRMKHLFSKKVPIL